MAPSARHDRGATRRAGRCERVLCRPPGGGAPNQGLRDRAIRRRDAGGDDPPLSRYLRDSGTQPLTPSVRTPACARSGFPEIPARRGPLCLSVSGGRLRLRRRGAARFSPAAGAWDSPDNAQVRRRMPSGFAAVAVAPAPAPRRQRHNGHHENDFIALAATANTWIGLGVTNSGRLRRAGRMSWFRHCPGVDGHARPL